MRYNFKVNFLRPSTRAILLPLIILASLFLVSCQEDKPVEPVKIGLVLYSFDDKGASLDMPTLNGARLAVEMLNAAGGIEINKRAHTVELVVEKVAPSPEQSIVAARKLINRDGVVALIGPQYSSGAIPAGAIAEMAKVPMISPSSTHPDTTKNRKYVFRMSFLDDVQGRAMASFAANDLGIRRAAVIYNESEPYSRGIAEVFRREFVASGGEISAFETFVTGGMVQDSQLKKIVASSADALYLPVFQEDLEPIVEKVRNAGFSARLLGSDTWEQDRLAVMAEYDDSFITNTWSKDVPEKVTETFVKQYQSHFNERPNGDSALTFDAFQLVFKAIEEQQNFSPEAIQVGLYRLGPYPGVTGKIDFVTSGDPDKSVVVMHIKNGDTSFRRIFNSAEMKSER